MWKAAYQTSNTYSTTSDVNFYLSELSVNEGHVFGFDCLPLSENWVEEETFKQMIYSAGFG